MAPRTVTVRVEAGTVRLHLPRAAFDLSKCEATELRDALNGVIPERIADLMHDPRISDLDVLRAAQALLAERHQDTENLAVAIDHLEREGEQPALEPVPAPDRLYLLCMWGDVDPQVCGPYRDEQERTEAAQDSRRAHGEANGLFRVDANGSLRVSSFTGGELEMPPAPTPATVAAARSCERCGSDPAPYRLQGVALCQSCDELLQAVAVGDRVRDPLDGTWREIVRIDGLADGGTCHMRDGGCMSVAECVRAEKRLPSEALD